MTSVIFKESEFETLKNLFEYLLKLQYPDDPNVLRRGKAYYGRVRKFTFYSESTIQNWFTPTGKPQFSDELFLRFCESFLEIHTQYSQILPNERERYYLIFEEWVNDICERMEWKNPLAYIPSRINIINQKEFKIENYDLESMLPDQVLSDKLLEAYKTVSNFYLYLKEKEYKDAWDMLSDDGKKSREWKEDYNRFKKEHYYSSGFSHPRIIQLTYLDENITEFQVSYTFDYLVQSTELDDLDLLELSDIDKFSHIVKEFSQKLQNLDSDHFKNVQLKSLFLTAAAENILSPFIPDLKIIQTYPKSVRKKFNQCELCLCKYVNGKWKISYIRDFEYYNEYQGIEFNDPDTLWGGFFKRLYFEKNFNKSK